MTDNNGTDPLLLLASMNQTLDTSTQTCLALTERLRLSTALLEAMNDFYIAIADMAVELGDRPADDGTARFVLLALSQAFQDLAARAGEFSEITTTREDN